MVSINTINYKIYIKSGKNTNISLFKRIFDDIYRFTYENK